MNSHRLQGWLGLAAMLVLPMLAHAQEATLSGRVSDATGGALPGVTVRAVHDASGNSFEAVTDERGDYRIPARVGAYRVTAELSGFAPLARAVTLLVGQQAVVNLQLAVTGVQESVTVTGEAPLLDVTQSSLGGNIDPRQLQDLPVNGRNWIDLVMLAPGARTNAVTEAPSDSGQSGPSSSRIGGDFQLNIDGQQVTQLVSGSGGEGQPRFSRDAIAEFEFLSSRFDATQGRSGGLQVNAVTKSGTNKPAGTFSTYFRHDRFNAADHVAKRVIPYQDRQVSTTFGGPIRKDKLHFFANYEYEREPKTFVYATPYPHFNRDLSAPHLEKKGGGRVDAQLSRQTRLSVRGSAFRFEDAKGVNTATGTPASAFTTLRETNNILGTLTQVIGSQTVNEMRVGYAAYNTNNLYPIKTPGTRFGVNGVSVLLRGQSAGFTTMYPDAQGQDVYSIRNDFTYSFTKNGRHTLKTGAEYLHQSVHDFRCVFCDGQLDATGGPVPVPVETLFPNLFDSSTWNLAPLSPVSIRWRQGFGSSFSSKIPRYTSAFWIQDDWTVLPRLTLNVGLRYDLELNAFASDVKMLPFLTGDQPNDVNNIGPRLGFTFSQNDRTVFRGGFGKYYGTVQNAHYSKFYEQSISIAVPYDGRADFATNPYNGPAPTYASLAANFCKAPFVAGCIRPEVQTGGAVYGPNMTMPYSYQSSVGVQRQVGNTMAVEADYVYEGRRGFQRDLPVNISYNPATGVNYSFNDLTRRPFPEWGYVSLTANGSRSNSHALQTAFTKRFRNGWQASGTYTLSALREAGPRPIQWNGNGFDVVPFETAPDLGGEYGPGVGDQRHRAVFNGIWQTRFGLQLSGLYFFGSGQRAPTNYGTDLRQIGAVRPNELRLRPNGTIVPLNNFVGSALHRVDLRIQRRFPLGWRAGIDGIAEVFNVFNHANYGSYTTQESSSNYGRPVQSINVAYAPRTLQLGLRFAF